MAEELILSPTEEEILASKFQRLLPGQIEIPIGPVDSQLPFPIFFNFTLSERKIIKTQIEIGWLHQGLEKLLEQVSSEEGCQIIRRVNPLCPNIFEHHFRLALGLEGLAESLLVKEKNAYHQYFITQILRLLGARSPQSSRVQKKLSGLGRISLQQAVSYGLTGPTLRACQEPYTGDAWSRLQVKLNSNKDSHPEGDLVIRCLPGRVRIRTPAFAHAAALPLFFHHANIEDIGLIMLSLGLVGTEIDR